jgi:undecaprenyl-diphosphatase
VSEEASGLSFPSGHVTAAVIVYGFIFYLVSLLIPAGVLRFLAQASCLVVIVLTALQRVHAGVHWPSDVLGGVLFGGLLLALLIWSHRRLRALAVGTWPFAGTDKKP